MIYVYRTTGKNDTTEIKLISSIGQLNFFQWAIRNKIIKYVQKNLDLIEADMKEVSKQNKARKKNQKSDSDARSENNYLDKKISNDIDDDCPDPEICSSEKINSVKINSNSKSSVKSSSNKSSSERTNRRQQLSKSVYEYGIKKSNIPIRLDFE